MKIRTLLALAFVASGALGAPPPLVKPPDADALAAWMDTYFAYGAGEIKVQEMPPQFRVPGYRMLWVTKTSELEPVHNDQSAVALEEGGSAAILGDFFADEERLKSPAPVKTDADLNGVREKLKRMLRSAFRVVLEPSLDRRGWKGFRVQLDVDYGHVDLPGYVKADDGTQILLGRVWDRRRSFAEQRRELIKLDGVPFQGPADARVTVVEYSDMQCAFCKRRTGDWAVLEKKLAPILKIKHYIKFFPLTSEHKWAFRAAAAGACFLETSSDLFFRWKEQVYRRQPQLDVAAVDSFAVDFADANGLAREAFAGCYLKPKSIARVLTDMTEGWNIRVRATPTYFVDGVVVSWPTDNLMEEFLRKTYLKGAGLPLPTPVTRTPAPAAQK